MSWGFHTLFEPESLYFIISPVDFFSLVFNHHFAHASLVVNFFVEVFQTKKLLVVERWLKIMLMGWRGHLLTRSSLDFAFMHSNFVGAISEVHPDEIIIEFSSSCPVYYCNPKGKRLGNGSKMWKIQALEKNETCRKSNSYISGPTVSKNEIILCENILKMSNRVFEILNNCWLCWQRIVLRIIWRHVKSMHF